VLSLAVPAPMAALIAFACRRQTMGPYRLGRPMAALAIACALVVIALNIVLVVDALS
jgi:manganese transport protein